MPKFVSVIGPNQAECSDQIYEFGIKLGKRLADHGKVILSGGMFGLMEAVFKGARQSEQYQFGMTVGILPGLLREEANPYADIIIPTGIGLARNQIVVNSGEVVVAIGGGAGTLSEIAFAWQLKKKIICFEGFGGWSEKLAHQHLDSRSSPKIQSAKTLEEIIEFINAP